MKKIAYLFLFCLLFSYLKGQESRVFITSDIKGIDLMYLSRFNMESPDTLKLEKGKESEVIFLTKSNGMFIHEVTGTFIPVYLFNGKSNKIHITDENESKLSFAYEGDNKEINEYLLNTSEFNQTQLGMILGQAAQKDVVTFNKVVDSVISLRKKELAKVKDAEFVQTETKGFEYMKKLFQISFQYQQMQMQQKPLTQATPELTKLMSEKPVEDAKLLGTDMYTNYLDAMLSLNLMKSNPAAQMGGVLPRLDYLPKYFKDKDIISALGEKTIMQYFASTTNMQTKTYEIKDDEKVLKFAEANIKNAAVLSEIKKVFEMQKKKPMKEQPTVPMMPQQAQPQPQAQQPQQPAKDK